MSEEQKDWIGVDFDSTLATYAGWQGEFVFGSPVPKMVEFVKKTLEDGEYDVKVFTARVSELDPDLRDRIKRKIQDWLESAGLPRLEVTCFKDFRMVMLYDDRAMTVEENTGRTSADIIAGLKEDVQTWRERYETLLGGADDREET